jgi:hypothetical protein
MMLSSFVETYDEADRACSGGGCRSTLGSAGSRHAQLGALDDQMLATGLIEQGSSSVPTRTTVSPVRPVESANRWLPQRAQNRRRTWWPLSAVLMYSAGVPLTSIDTLGKMALTVPLDEMRWQSRHQQTLEIMGSELRR